MDYDQIVSFLRALGSERVESNGVWVNSPCPFSRWRHAKGRDTHPSFGVMVMPGGASHGNCFACGMSGDLKMLLWRLQAYRGDGPWFRKASQILMSNGSSIAQLDSMEKRTGLDGLRDRISKVKYGGYDPPVIPPSEGRSVLDLEGLQYDVFPEDDYQQLPEIEGEALAYLLSSKRNLSPEVIKEWGLRWQPFSRRVVIPVRDMKGQLVGISGRCLDHFNLLLDRWESEDDKKILHSYGFRRNLFLFGEHRVTTRGRRGVMVEGHFDAMYLWQHGIEYPVAPMGTALSAVQVEKLVTFFSEVVIFPDGDKAGIEAAKVWEYALRGRVRTRVLDVQEDGRDPDNYSDEELRAFGLVDEKAPT